MTLTLTEKTNGVEEGQERRGATGGRTHQGVPLGVLNHTSSSNFIGEGVNCKDLVVDGRERDGGT